VKPMQAVARIIGKPYALGGTDCFSVVLEYMELLGVTVPGEFEGLPRDTYRELYERDPGEARDVMVRFVDAHLVRKKPHLAFAGDVMLLSSGAKAAPFLAINAGNATAVTAFAEHGVISFPLAAFEIQGAWQCPVTRQV